jgi:hypothetical protein
LDQRLRIATLPPDKRFVGKESHNTYDPHTLKTNVICVVQSRWIGYGLLRDQTGFGAKRCDLRCEAALKLPGGKGRL